MKAKTLSVVDMERVAHVLSEAARHPPLLPDRMGLHRAWRAAAGRVVGSDLLEQLPRRLRHEAERARREGRSHVTGGALVERVLVETVEARVGGAVKRLDKYALLVGTALFALPALPNLFINRKKNKETTTVDI